VYISYIFKYIGRYVDEELREIHLLLLLLLLLPDNHMNHLQHWSDLPAEIVALIVAKMNDRTRISYACTSSHSLLDLLLLPKSTLRTPPASPLVRRLAAALPMYPRSQTYLVGMVEVWSGIYLDVQAIQHALTRPTKTSVWLK